MHYSERSPYREATPQRKELAALKNLLSQTDQILATTPELPEDRTARCRELLACALALTDDLLKQTKLAAAATLGRKGGSVIAKRAAPTTSASWPHDARLTAGADRAKNQNRIQGTHIVLQCQLCRSHGLIQSVS